MHARTGRTWLALIAVTWLAGCGNTQPASRPPTGQPSAVTALPPAAVDLVTRSGGWAASQHVLDTAVQALTQACLSARGFHRPAPPPPPPRQVTAEDEAGIVGLPRRQRVGYGITTGGLAPAPVDDYYQRLTPGQRAGYDLALLGPPGSGRPVALPDGGRVTVSGQGCQAQARSRLAGTVEGWARATYIPEQFGNRLAEQATTSGEYRAALAGWQRCMARQGHPYASPEQAQHDLRARRARQREVGGPPGQSGAGGSGVGEGASGNALQREAGIRAGDSGGRLTEVEVAVAVADGRCALHAHLPAASLAAQRRLAAHLPPADRALLAGLTRRRDGAVRRAVAVLGSRQL